MIKALLIILMPRRTWDRISAAGRGVGFVLAFYLLPTLALSVGVELWGLLKWGRRQQLLTRVVQAHVSPDLAVQYGIVRCVATLGVVFLGALIIKSVAETFHSRNNHTQCLTLMAYGVGPLLLVRMFDAFSIVSPWITFAIGMAVMLGAIYNGVPRVLKPDPPQAFGLFVASAVMLTFLCGVGRLLSLTLLEGRWRLFQ